jgi:hypothetical protein
VYLRALYAFLIKSSYLSNFFFFFLLLLKAYAVTALMKIYAFEIAAGRKVDLLDEVCF